MASLTKITLIKLIELILVVVLLIMHLESGLQTGERAILADVAVGGYLIILIGIFAGAFTGTPVNRRIDLYFTLIGCILFLVVGILVVQHSGRTATIGGILAIIEGVLFLVDAIFTFRGEA